VRRCDRNTNREDRDRAAEMRLTERTRKCLLIAMGPGYMSGSRIYPTSFERTEAYIKAVGG